LKIALGAQATPRLSALTYFAIWQQPKPSDEKQHKAPE